MVSKIDGRIVETATEARQAEPGPSVLAVLSFGVALGRHRAEYRLVYLLFARITQPYRWRSCAGRRSIKVNRVVWEAL